MALTTYITPPCPVCRTTTEMRLDMAKLVKWRKGHLIQNVFPSMHPDVRELIQTGTHPECWDKMFEGFDD